jgi:hypothetical protein
VLSDESDIFICQEAASHLPPLLRVEAVGRADKSDDLIGVTKERTFGEHTSMCKYHQYTMLRNKSVVELAI